MRVCVCVYVCAYVCICVCVRACTWLLSRECVHYTFTTLFVTSLWTDTGEPSKFPSEDNSDSTRDRDFLLGKMSIEEQRRRYPKELVNIYSKCHEGLLI